SAGHIGIATQSCVLSLCSFFQWGMKFHFMSVYVFLFFPKAKRKKGVLSAMRYLLSIAAIIMILISGQTLTYATSNKEMPPVDIEIGEVQPSHPHEDKQAEQDDKVSVIVEVDGDPAKHKNFLDLHHPYVEVVATYDKLFNGLALQATPEKLAKMESLEFIKAIHPVRTYEAITELTPQADELTSAVIPSSLNTT